MSTKTFIAVIAAVGFIAGWIALGTPTSVVASQYSDTKFSCGSPLIPSSKVKTLDEAYSSLGLGVDSVEAKCEDAFAPRRFVGWSLVVLGAVAGVGAGLAIRSERKQGVPPAYKDVSTPEV